MNPDKASGRISRRQHMQARQRRQKLVTYLIWSRLGIAVLAVVGVFIWQAVWPAVVAGAPPYEVIALVGACTFLAAHVRGWYEPLCQRSVWHRPGVS